MALTFLRKHDVLARTGLARSVMYDLIRKGEFPAPIKITDHRSGWIESEVEQWMEGRVAVRDTGRASA